MTTTALGLVVLIVAAHVVLLAVAYGLARLVVWAGHALPDLYADTPQTGDEEQGVNECQGADFSRAFAALEQSMIAHADRDGLKGVQRAVFIDRGGHATDEACPTATPEPDPHEYWCQWPEAECVCPPAPTTQGGPL